jgi:DNA polymerase I
VGAFADMAYDGVFVDGKAWSALIVEADLQQKKAREEIEQQIKGVVQTDLFGQVDVNFERDAELRDILSRLLGKPIREINKHVLKRLDHPIGESLLSYREASKLISTYGQSFLKFIHPKTGRIHADFQQIGAPTGRVSCRDPNLQNIPRGSRFR